MKKIILVIIIIIFGLYLTLPKIVFYESPNINLRGITVYYKNDPFTGTLLKKVPFVDKTAQIKLVNGSFKGNPSILDKNITIINIPFTDTKILINPKAEKSSETVMRLVF